MLEPMEVQAILDHYPHATAFQRWHMRGRLRLCPYDALLKHLGGGSLLDIGCGFGHLAWYLSRARPGLRYHGADIDERKVDLALGSLGGARPQGNGSAPDPEFRRGDAMRIEDWPARFDNIVILDVLYLLPWEAQQELLGWALEKLAPGPDSALVIKNMDAPQGLKGFSALAEEWIMVTLLGRTRSSGTIRGAVPATSYWKFAREKGFQCQVENLPTFHPSFILRMHR